MGRASGDHHIALHHHSTIALLQERFRQLQRVKEMRQEKELLKTLSSTTTTSDTPPPQHHHEDQILHYEPPNKKAFLHTETFFPPPAPTRPSSQLSLSLWPPASCFRPGTPQPSGSHRIANKRWINDINLAYNYATSTLPAEGAIVKQDHHERYSDVDTSLHL